MHKIVTSKCAIRDFLFHCASVSLRYLTYLSCNRGAFFKKSRCHRYHGSDLRVLHFLIIVSWSYARKDCTSREIEDVLLCQRHRTLQTCNKLELRFSVR